MFQIFGNILYCFFYFCGKVYDMECRIKGEIYKELNLYYPPSYGSSNASLTLKNIDLADVAIKVGEKNNSVGY